MAAQAIRMTEESMEVAMPVSAAEPIAKVRGVTKRYGQQVALDNISFELRRGEIVALLGPNGAGKTTAIRTLLGLTRQTSGEVLLFGRSPIERAGRLRTGVMLQIARMPESIRVREHIDLFRSYYPHPLPAAEVLSIAGLSDIAGKLFGDLSGGQKQRMLFALALCGDPDLLFLDEPTLGMDIEARRALWEQVRLLAARGKTVLLTTHYLPEAEALATRVLLLQAGRIVAQGTPAELKGRIQTSTIKCRTTVPEAMLRALPGVSEVRLEAAGSVLLLTSTPETLLRALLPLDADLHGLEVTGTAFEDAFLALTSRQPPATA
ncbi:MAG TPA: ABC transporter ATP-binding protein [Acidobacteriaceae bacterium]